MMRGPSVARRGGPGLAGTKARTAVIAGTAQADANALNGQAVAGILSDEEFVAAEANALS